jgi:hypothetical protein
MVNWTEENALEAAEVKHDAAKDKRIERLEGVEWYEGEFIHDAQISKEIEMELEELLTEYRDMKIELAYPLEQLTKLEKQIKDIVKETGETAEIEGARIKVIPPRNPRARWDTKALEGFAAAHPELLELKTEYWPSPSVRIVID